MHPDLERLATLTDLDTELDAANATLRRAEESVATATAALKATEARRDAVKAELETARGEERDLTRKIEQYETRRKRAIQALETGAGDAAAAERQRVQCTEILDQAETDTLLVMERIEGIAARLLPEEAAVRDAAARLSEVTAVAPAAIGAATRTRDGIQARRDGVHAELPGELRGRYDLLRKKKHPAVARIVGDSCAACRMTVPRHQSHEISRGHIEACRGCGRWMIPG